MKSSDKERHSSNDRYKSVDTSGNEMGSNACGQALQPHIKKESFDNCYQLEKKARKNEA